MKPAVITFALLVMLTSLSAWSITDTYFGNKMFTQDARSQAMGAIGSYNNSRPFAISINPANIGLMKDRVGLQGGMFINRNEDTRSIPLYNSFDNYIDDAVYASNINFFDDYAAAGYGNLKLGAVSFGLGAFYKPMISFDGIYDEEIRNNRNTDNDGYPEKVAINGIINNGKLDQAAGVFGFTISPGDRVSIGFGGEYSMLNGYQEEEKTIRWSQWAIDTAGVGVLPNYTYTLDADLEGTRLKGGMVLSINERFGFGASYTHKTTLERTGNSHVERDAYLNNVAVDATTPIDEDYILPTEYRFGMQYQPRNIMRTWFNLDAEYVQWTDVADAYDDCLNIYAGVEHFVENRLPLRLGFQSTTSYLRNVEADGSIIAKKIVTPQISAGTGFDLAKNFTLDFGFAYSWREYEALDLFMDSYYNDKTYTGNTQYVLWPNQYIELRDRGWENPDKVRENNISLNAGLTFTW
jgi:uncharacterized protein (UPF0333 family)